MQQLKVDGWGPLQGKSKWEGPLAGKSKWESPRGGFPKAPAHAGAGGLLSRVPFRRSLLEEDSPRGGEQGPASWTAPSLFGAVSAHLALLGGSLGPLVAPSHRPVALSRLPWDPFGAFGVHFLSLFGVSFSRLRFCLDFGPQNGAKIDDFQGCLMCAKCSK